MQFQVLSSIAHLRLCPTVIGYTGQYLNISVYLSSWNIHMSLVSAKYVAYSTSLYIAYCCYMVILIPLFSASFYTVLLFG